uniref:Uncharacterized protein n=1 Tax=Tanacetum cinerariifolium TaxID=118510 RepID=A0A6L2K718_TANCI|nr:hypothetical protein [Tanacetum cinerariifolium]
MQLTFKRTARISVRACCFFSPCLVAPPSQPLSPPTDYQTAPPSTPNISPPLSHHFFRNLTKQTIDHSKVNSTPFDFTFTSTNSTIQNLVPSSHKLKPIKLIFSTPPTSPHSFFYSLKDLPPRTTNPPPPRPSFESIEYLANKPSHLLAMEPPIPPLPPQLLSLGLKNPFPKLTHEMFFEQF